MEDQLYARDIRSNEEYIKKVFKKICGIELTDMNFAEGLNGDLILNLTFNGRAWMIKYSKKEDAYILFHENTAKNHKKKHRFHKERVFISFPILAKFIYTSHRVYTKKPKMQKLFEQINK